VKANLPVDTGLATLSQRHEFLNGVFQ